MCCVYSGGNWTNAGNAGVWAVNLNNSRSNSNNNYGFRSDSMPNTPYAASVSYTHLTLPTILRV